MRKLTGAVFLSLDGVMQAPGGPNEDPSGGFRFGGWTFPYWDEGMSGPFGKIIDAEYDLLLGKRTYDIFAAYWPYNQDNPIGEKFQRIDKHVLTHSDEPLRWENSHTLSGDTAAAVALLEQHIQTVAVLLAAYLPQDHGSPPRARPSEHEGHA